MASAATAAAAKTGPNRGTIHGESQSRSESGTGGSTQCSDCSAELAPPPKRLRCYKCTVGAANTDASAEVWAYDGSSPAVFRTRDEYLARFEYLRGKFERCDGTALHDENEKLRMHVCALCAFV
jgi:hypothetical protein